MDFFAKGIIDADRVIEVSPDYLEVLGTDRIRDVNKLMGKQFLDYRRQWKENPRNHIVGDFPLHLDIEVCNLCNLRCAMCQIPFDKMEPGFMDLSLYDKILDEVKNSGVFLPSIKFNFRGEPLMHPAIVEFVKKARCAGVFDVQFNTNGTLLTEELSRQLIDAGLSRIKFSVDSINPETYSAIRKGAIYENTISNILKFIEIRNDLKRDMPSVQVQMVLMNATDGDAKDYISFWEDKVNRIGFSRHRTNDNLIGQSSNTSTSGRERIPCLQLWQRLVVLWNGVVLMCCGDHQMKNPIGDARTQTIAQIWKGANMEKMRSLHLQRKFNEISACKDCQINYL